MSIKSSMFFPQNATKMTSATNSALTFLLLSLLITFSFASEIFVNFLTGSNQLLNCESTYAPPWSKIGANGEYKIIGVNGKSHPNLNEPRFSFTNEANSYFLRISDVRLFDSGKFVCGSDNPITYVITVMRYGSMKNAVACRWVNIKVSNPLTPFPILCGPMSMGPINN